MFFKNKKRINSLENRLFEVEVMALKLSTQIAELEERITYMAVSLTDLNDAVDKATAAQSAAAAKINALVADVKKASDDLAAAVAAGHPDNTVDPAEIAVIVDKLKASTDALTSVVG